MKLACSILLLSLMGCSHDSKRENPLDPELTPPVTLSAVLNDSSGAVSLSWSEYAGTSGFAAYLVLRNETQQIVVDTLAVINVATATGFIDSTLVPNTAYDYRVSVANDDGFLAPSQPRGVSGFTVNAVVVTRIEPFPQSGVIVVRWQSFHDPGFQRYRIHRRQVGTDADSLLGSLGEASDTVFVDSTARHAVDYLYHVVVEAAGLELVSATHEGRLTLSPVEITRADFESRKASATLEWTVFDGPRFDSYEVWRTVGANSQRIGVIGDADSTGLVDRGLRGSTQYNYQVRVRTRREEEIPSLMRSGGFHGLVAEWGLDLEGTSSLQVFVRLSGRSGGGVDALTTVSQAEIRRVEFDGEGQVLQSRQVGDILNLFRGRTIRASIPALLVQTARQLLSVADALVGAGVMALTSGGEEQLVEETTLDLDMSDGTEHNRVSSNLEIEIDGGWYTIDVQCLDLAGWTNRVRQSNGHDSLTTPYLQNSPPRLNLPVVYQG